MIDTKWDIRFLRLAKHISEWSRDPSTKVGAVIVDNKTKRVVSMGFNGFPRNIKDEKWLYENRDEKLKRILHAEQNALLFAPRNLDNHSLYTYPLFPCHRCVLEVIQKGVNRIVSTTTRDLKWDESISLSETLCVESYVDVIYYSEESLGGNL